MIAGEASGDRIAARAIKATRRLAESRNEEVEFYGIGGAESERQGMRLYHTIEEMAVVGFIEVAKRFSFFRKVLKEMEYLLASNRSRPNVLVLVDYPGFNIRLAKKAKKLGIRVVYYVSPQVWAWHKKRVHDLKKVVDDMLVIFPFEEEIYREAGLTNVQFVGHPLLESIEQESRRFTTREAFAKEYQLDPAKEWLLVFSGSRTEEVRRLAPVMTEAATKLKEASRYETIIVEAPSIPSSFYQQHTKGEHKSFRAFNRTHELMHHSQMGILKSGTTTLEAALLGLPGVICYKTHPVTFSIGKRLVKLPFIGLANIVLGRKLYPELLQKECTASNIVREITHVKAEEAEFRTALIGLSDHLGAGHKAPSVRVAQTILA